MPHMGQGPPKSSKRYISDLFEKSVPNMVTYLCKVLSQLHFPKGGGWKSKKTKRDKCDKTQQNMTRVTKHVKCDKIRQV